MFRAAVVLSIIGVTAQAQDACKSCHPRQTAAFLSSPMGKALSPTTGGESGTFFHPVSKSRFQVRSDGTTVLQSLERAGISAEYPIAFRIGSGNHATGYLIRIQGELFQSPIAFYNRRGLWDVAPGYESNPRPDFNRRVTKDCLGCHSSGALSALESITCERCHGSAAEHLRNPVRATILNPARLERVRRDSVCEQCHLSGEARIANPGLSFDRFQVGQTIEDTYSVFVYDRPRDDLRVVSHVEQLALSRCARESEGRLWCGSCHSPHGVAIDVASTCRTCHASGLPPTHAPMKECASCHMPKRQAKDGGHSAFTDHRIRRAPGPDLQGQSTLALRGWRPNSGPALQARNLGMAQIMVGERDGSAALINSGYRNLQSVFPKFERDADVLANLAMVLFLKDQKAEALKLLSAAVAVRPDDAELHLKLAVVRRGAGDLTGAKASLERAIALDPVNETAYHLLADVEPNAASKKAMLERYLTVNPQSVIAREAIRELAGR